LRRGYYVVYLFHSTEPVLHLSLNQGTTAVREEFGGEARDILADRAAFMRKRAFTQAYKQLVKLGYVEHKKG
jgi:hypothetical protein